MKIMMTPSIIGIAFLAIFIAAAGTAHAQEDIKSLRGITAIDEGANAAELNRQKVGQKFTRNYRQQPPLIPHKTFKYQINLKVNQCMTCHDWPQNTAAGAPKISETHYIGRDGERLNHVSTARWFCNQCHVPQIDAKPLVPNTFRSAEDLH